MSHLTCIRFLRGGRAHFSPVPGMTLRDLETPDIPGDAFEEGDLFLLDGSGAPERTRRFAAALRSHPLGFVKPLFAAASLDPFSEALADGRVDSLEEAETRAGEILTRLKELNRETLLEEPDYRLLAYLHTRPGRELLPLRMPFSPGVYSFPLAEILSGPGDEAIRWLQTLSERRLLSRGTLVDRIRLCPRCEGSHLNYVDLCPECGSLDIVATRFIHCFTCGRVAPQREFLRENTLQCPFCGTRLRHLGSDYDHPLESHLCNTCGHQFVEPAVTAACFRCETRTVPEDLVVRHVTGYSLSEKGRTSARIGTLEDVYELLDQFNYVVPAYFLQLLDWQMALTRRYPDITFSLLGLRFANLPEITDALGRHRTKQLVEAVAERLRNMVRTTDVTTRTSLGIVWLLLPRTDREGARILASRLEAVRGLVTPDETLEEGRAPVTFDFRMTVLVAPEDLFPDENASLLLARLSGNLEE